ncbi:hypothetical protein V7S43_014319 [Phytophthora oleae]|uniref:Uncharacterized protein n=1 Tax=Phytophthora oleae TaxID=2107226 RepID=A0ABD3F4Z9_9STRA
MEQQSTLAVESKSEMQAEPEPQPQLVGSPVDDATKGSSKSKKKKKKNKKRRKSLEKTQSEVEELLNSQQDVQGEEDNQQDENDEQDNQHDEVSIQQTTVKETVIESTVITETATKEPIEEAVDIKKQQLESESVAVEQTIAKETGTEESTKTVDVEKQQEESESAASVDELAPPSLERTTSLDTLKATGTKAVGSLFSRFKVGRKKPSPSRTESAAKLEGVLPSPVKTAVKRFESPEKKNLDELPMRTKRDFFGEGEQCIHVSAEKDRYDTLEKQRKEEKDAEEAANDARRTPPSSTRSNEEIRAELEAAKEQIEAASNLTLESTETVEVVEKKNVGSANSNDNSELSTVVVEESIKGDDVASASKRVDEVEFTAEKNDMSAEVTAPVVSEVAAAEETINPDESASTSAPMKEDDAEARGSEVDTPNSTDKQVVAVGAEIGNPAALKSDIVSQEVTEEGKFTTDVTKGEPASLKLDLNLEPAKTTAEEQQPQNDLVESSSSKSVDVAATIETDKNETQLSGEIELLQPKVTPPTSNLPTEAVEPVKPERMSPVKSLASRFEGKREQSLDNLKFRTVREFFPTERSIRVGAEKQKYEAQAQQQQLKAKAEEEAKAKYNTGPGIKSPAKEDAAHAPSPELKPAESESKPVDDAVGAFKTPETTSSRKKFSFDDEYASANSPSKFSDEALTPVKSIASRFEGKREQSLDNLKFRTVREFFPEERSVRVGSEKKKLEAQAQQDSSLDKLRFRTVREFFPEEGKRSIHVGAEKAKFEAITKQQEQAAKAAEAAEELKLKHVVPSSTPETEKIDAPETSLNDDAGKEISSPVVDKEEVAVSDPVVVEQIEESVVVKTDVGDGDEAQASVETTLVLTEEKDDAPATTAPEIGVVSSEVKSEQPDENLTEESEQEAEKASIEDELAKRDLGDFAAAEKEEPTDAVVTEESTHTQQTITEIKQIEESLEIIHDAEPTAVNDLVDLDLGEVAVGNSVGLTEDDTSDDVLVSEPLINVEEPETNEETVEGAGEEIATSELVELDLDAPVEKQAGLGAAVTSESITVSPNFDDQEAVKEFESEVEESVSKSDNGLVELDLGEPPVETTKEQSKQQPKSKRPMLTTERSFVMEEDHTIETEDTVVVGERPMTDGEDEFEPLSPSKARPAHELFAGITSPKLKKKTSTPRLTRKVSAGSVGSAKSPAKTTVPIPMKRASITAPTASYMAKKVAEAEELHRSSPQLKKKTSASKMKGTVSDTGFIKPQPAAPTVPVPMKRASITAPTASYTARRAAEEDAHKSSPQPKQQHSASKQKGTVNETGFVKPPPAAPTVPVPMKRASITAPTASWQARNTPNHESEAHVVQKNHTPKQKGTVGPTGFVKPTPPPPTVPVAPKRASIMAPTASFRAKKTAEQVEEVEITPSAPVRNKRYSNVKSKVVEGINTGKTHAVTHKIITKEEFIAAERRKSLGSAGVRSVLDTVDRRASLSANVTIVGPPEPFVRSAHSRKKLSSTVPRYMNYENTRGYAERAKLQFERRKRLEEENAAKSEKRQRELRMFFADKQQKSLMSSADEVRRGLEAHEFAKAAKESELEAQKALRRDNQLARSSRSLHRPSSASSSAGTSSSNSAALRASKKSSVSSVSVEEKVVATPVVESTVVETEPVIESIESTTVVTEETVEVIEEEVAAVDQEVVEVEEQSIPVPVVDEDPELEHIAKKIDFDEASSDSDEKDVVDE